MERMRGPYSAEENEAWHGTIVAAIEAQQAGDVDGYLAAIRTILTQFEHVDGVEEQRQEMLALLGRIERERNVRAARSGTVVAQQPPA